MAAGAVGGALFGAVGLANVGGLAHTIGHAAAGALSGGIGSVIQGDGGNAFQGMLIGGFSAGASEFLGNNVPFLRDSEGGNFADYLSNMTKRAVIGATVGGATSAATGGDFWQGAALGGSTSAIAYTANDWMHSVKDTLARMHQTLVISNVAFKSVMGFEAWDSTAYPFAGTKYGGYSRDGPGEPTSRIDIGTMYHDDAIDRTGTSCANLLNADIRQAHWNLAKWFLGINSFQDGNYRERSTRTLYRIETYRRLE